MRSGIVPSVSEGWYVPAQYNSCRARNRQPQVLGRTEFARLTRSVGYKTPLWVTSSGLLTIHIGVPYNCTEARSTARWEVWVIKDRCEQHPAVFDGTYKSTVQLYKGQINSKMSSESVSMTIVNKNIQTQSYNKVLDDRVNTNEGGVTVVQQTGYQWEWDY